MIFERKNNLIRPGRSPPVDREYSSNSSKMSDFRSDGQPQDEERQHWFDAILDLVVQGDWEEEELEPHREPDPPGWGQGEVFVGELETDDGEPVPAPAPEPMDTSEEVGFINPRDTLIGFMESIPVTPGCHEIAGANFFVVDAANVIIGFFAKLADQSGKMTAVNVEKVLKWYLDTFPPCAFVCTEGRPLMLHRSWRALRGFFGQAGNPNPPDMEQAINFLGKPMITVSCQSVLGFGSCKPGETPGGRADDAAAVYVAMLGNRDKPFPLLTGDNCSDSGVAPELQLELSFNDGKTPSFTIATSKVEVPPWERWSLTPAQTRAEIDVKVKEFFDALSSGF